MLVEFKDVVKTYGEGEGKQTAVDHVSFMIAEGEFVVILGQSGAGKSTILNMLGGMDTPTEGTVTVEGREISRMNDRQLGAYRAQVIGFIFQFYNLLPSLTAYENIALTRSIVKNAVEPDKNEWHEAVVGSIYRSCESQGIAYLRDDYEKTGAEYTPTLLMTDDESAHDASTLKYVTSVNSRSDMIAAYEKSMEVVNIMVYMMVIFSTVMIVVVLYNSGSLSFNERVKELATLKVMGLQSSQIRHLLTVQNIWLSVIGIIIGTPLGNISLNAMMNSNGENFDYSLSVPVIDYIISGILVLVVSVLVSFMFSSRIKKLDLVETLKGVE